MSNKCKRCGYECAYSYLLLKHLNRKFPCNPSIANVPTSTLISELTENKGKYLCRHCNKGFNTPQGKYQHQKNCKCNNTNIDVSERTEKSILLDMMQEMMERMKRLEERHNIPPNSNTNSHNTTNTTNNIQNNVIINSPVTLREFGCENMDALPISLIGTSFINLKYRDLLENLHFDPNYPENHNVRIKSLKRKVMEIYRNSKWNVISMDMGILELIQKATRIFNRYGNNNKDDIVDADMTEEEYVEVMKQLDEIEDAMDKVAISNIAKDVQNMLESNSNHVTVVTE